MKRRNLLLGGGAVLGGLAVPLSKIFAGRSLPAAGTNALRADPARILDLAPGFAYTIVERQLERMEDGFRVPRRPDGMACFLAANGSWVLLRNHELTEAASDADYLEGRPAPHAFDPGSFGAVTRVELEPRSLRRLRTNLVLCGTARNCAGGISPWGWLTCEESTRASHGYVFVCSRDALEAEPPVRVAGYGRCRREAAVVDPETNIAYLTEDEVDSCFYRFVPQAKATPFTGTLEALCVAAAPRFSTSTSARTGERLDVTWVPLDDPDAAREPLRVQAQNKGAALFRRAEGLWLDGRRVYICASAGGAAESGQIFVLELDAPGQLSLLVESNDRTRLDMPDNITVGPGGALYMAEDGPGGQFIRAMLPSGELFDLGYNAASGGEFAGVCFSPDQSVLFANLQEEGITVAISGPFPT